MDIRRDTIVPLGYGKYIKSDKIMGLEPIEEERGPRRRTKVYVEGISSPVIASRTETTILRDMVSSSDEHIDMNKAIELLEDFLEDIRDVGPMLRKSIKDEGGLDLDDIESRIIEILDYRGEDAGKN